MSWAVQVALGSLQGCFGLLSVVFNLFQLVSSRPACLGSMRFFRLYLVVMVRSVFLLFLRFLHCAELF